MDRKIAARVALVAASVAFAGLALAGCAPAGNPVATLQVVGETYKIELATPELVEHAQALLNGEDVASIPLGRVVRDDPGVNAPWSWHIDPATLEFADMTIEVCDGLPSFVEDETVTSPDYCPWSAQIIAIEGLPGGTVTAAPRAAVTPLDETCAELSDIGTIEFNFAFALSEGRLIGTEYTGAMDLAERMLGRLDVPEGTELADAVDALRAVRAGSDGWRAAFGEAAQLCETATGTFGVYGWVGG